MLRSLALLLSILLVSGHAAGLQVVAWAGMVAERAPQVGLVRAVQSTVDGSAPCAVCAAVDHLLMTQHAADRQQPGVVAAPAPYVAPGVEPVLVPLVPSVVVVARLGSTSIVAPHPWVSEVAVPPPRGT